MTQPVDQRDEALATLRRFLMALPEPSHEAILAAEPSPELLDTALLFLQLAFSGRWGLDRNLLSGTQQAAVILAATGQKRQQVFDLALQPHTLPAHSVLAPLVSSILGDALFPAMLNAIDDDNQERAAMAIYLARALYFGRWASPLTEGQADLINAGVAVREQLPTSPSLASAIDAWLPLYATV